MTLPINSANHPHDTLNVHVNSVKTSEMVPSANRHINIKALGQLDLESLKKNDPFMYYSIPSVRDADMFLEEIDVSMIDQPHPKGRKYCTPNRKIDIDDETSSSQSIVARRTCISFECHTDLLMYDILNEIETEDDANVDIQDLLNALAQ